MTNIVRGFRRIGWVLTAPVAALLILVFFESAKEFSSSDYEATISTVDLDNNGKSTVANSGDIFDRITGTQIIEMPAFGYANFEREVPREVTAKVIQDFIEHRRNSEGTAAQKTEIYKVKAPDGKLIEIEGPAGASEGEIISQAKRLYGESIPQPPSGYRLELPSNRKVDLTFLDKWQFTVHKRVNKLKLTGLVLASLVIPVLVIQGFISIIAWVVQGFKEVA